MIQELSTKLNEAVAIERRTQQAYALAALAVEEGRAGAMDVAKATKEQQAANKRVDDLTAAINAQSRPKQLVSQRAEAAAKAQQALKDAVQGVRQQGLRFDALRDALADVGRDFNQTASKAYIEFCAKYSNVTPKTYWRRSLVEEQFCRLDTRVCRFM